MAPMAAASVGVASPHRIPPKTEKIRTAKAMMPRRAGAVAIVAIRHRPRLVVAPSTTVPASPSSGRNHRPADTAPMIEPTVFQV